MASNPNNAVGTNGAFGGRTSVNAFNDVLSIFNSRGIVQGWDMAPDSGMNITIGGDGSNRDVAIAQDNIGNKTTINNISEEPIPVEIPAAPATGSRIDAVVAYVDNPAEGSATATDNYGACGLIVVSGTAASSPVAPTEADIRTAITADGGAGTVAYYVVLGTVTVATGTTDISANMLTKGSYAGVPSNNISDGAITSSKLASNAVTTAKINNSAVTSSKIDWTTLTRYTDIRHANSGIAVLESAPTELNSVTITTPGVYLLLANYSGRQEASGYVHFYSKFTSTGGTFIPSPVDSRPGFAQTTTTVQDELAWVSMNCLINVTNSNTTVKSVVWQSATTSARIDYIRTLTAIRIG